MALHMFMLATRKVCLVKSVVWIRHTTSDMLSGRGVSASEKCNSRMILSTVVSHQGPSCVDSLPSRMPTDFAMIWS